MTDEIKWAPYEEWATVYLAKSLLTHLNKAAVDEDLSILNNQSVKKVLRDFRDELNLWTLD